MKFNKLVLFDLDGTLFDTQQFIVFIRKRLMAMTGSDKQTLKRLEQKYRKKFNKLPFNLLHYCEFVGHKFNKKGIKSV